MGRLSSDIATAASTSPAAAEGERKGTVQRHSVGLLQQLTLTLLRRSLASWCWLSPVPGHGTQPAFPADGLIRRLPHHQWPRDQLPRLPQCCTALPPERPHPCPKRFDWEDLWHPPSLR